MLRAITGVVDDPIMALNILFVAGFFFVGAASYLLFHRTVRMPSVAVLLAISVATLPWHFGRFRHILLTDYSPIPIALLLACLMWSGWWTRSVGRQLVAVGGAAYVGTGGLYYAFFAGLCLGPVFVWRLYTEWPRRSWWPDAAVVAAIPIALVACVAVQYSLAREAALDQTFRRSPAESLLFAGDPVSLVAPWPFFDGFAEGWAHLNVLGSVAVMAAFVVVFVALVGGARLPSRGLPSLTDQELRPWFRLLLWMTIWWLPGLGFLFAALVNPTIRSWGRLSLVILYISMVIFGIMLRRVMRARPAAVPAALLGLSLLVSWQVLLDHRRLMPTWSEAFEADMSAYASEVRANVRPGCAILQLPALSNPEDWSDDREMGAYDHMWMPLYMSDFQWSFGVVAGTESGQAAQGRYLGGVPLEQMLENARQDGFCAVHVDELGMSPEALREADKELGAPLAARGQWRLYSLPPVADGS